MQKAEGIKQKINSHNKNNLIDTDKSVVISRGKGQSGKAEESMGGKYDGSSVSEKVKVESWKKES